MALASQIDRAVRIGKPPVGTQAIDREPTAPPVDDMDRRRVALGLCAVAIRHTCNAAPGVSCTNRNHARDVKAARRALILAGLAPDPYPSPKRPHEISCAPSPERRRADALRAQAKAEAGRPRSDRVWLDDAACRDENPELFFPPDNERRAERELRERVATAVCGRCPVSEACLQVALDRRETGVWGGTTDEERISLRRRKRTA